MKRLFAALAALILCSYVYAQTVGPPIIPPGSSTVVSTNNSWSGTNTWNSTSTFNANPAFTNCTFNYIILGAGAAPVNCTPPGAHVLTALGAGTNTSTGIKTFSPIFDVVSQYFAVGDGVTNNNTAFANALAAAVATGNGQINVPCGVYKLTAKLIATIPSNTMLTVQGGGADCTEIYFSGAVDGFYLTFGNYYSALRFNDITLSTDTINSNNALTGFYLGASLPLGASGYANYQFISRNLQFRGHDYYGAQTQYWAIGGYLTGLSNMDIYDPVFQGAVGSTNGTGYFVQGNAAQSNYSVVFNVFGGMFNNCNRGIFMGEWTQGFFLNAVNMTNVNYGVQTGNGGGSFSTDVLDQLSINNSQINSNIIGVDIEDTFFNDLLMSNDTMITPTGTAVKLQGTQSIISNSQFGGGVGSTIGIDIAKVQGNQSKITNNSILNYGTGVKVESTMVVATAITNNTYNLNTANFNVNSAARIAIFTEPQPLTFSGLPACNQSTLYSQFAIVDSPSVTYNQAIATGGGTSFVSVRCNGTTWYLG